MFKRKQTNEPKAIESSSVPAEDVASQENTTETTSLPQVSLVGLSFEDEEERGVVLDECMRHAPEYRFVAIPETEQVTAVERSCAVVAAFLSKELLDELMDRLVEVRKKRDDGSPILLVVLSREMLTEFGEWLLERAEAESLEGLRLVLAETFSSAIPELSDKLQPFIEPNVISMPSSPEVDNSPRTYFFSISPQTRKTVRTISELAQNGIERIYLLGGPGSGKTSLAYYYWLKRNKGRFIAVNLNAESSGDKDAMKSLLCGHVTGAFPGASSREGAFSYADSGVTFLDESHGVTGVVMQVLMEALDTGQYLPFGATKKRLLDAAVIFASNRSWEQLRSEINLDEHARLGAMIVPVHDLVTRREDLIVGVAIAMAKFKRKCTTWSAPSGIGADAWQMITSCPWSGNMRTLFRVMETALVAHALGGEPSAVLDDWDMQEGLTLWEPENHHSHKLYTSYR